MSDPIQPDAARQPEWRRRRNLARKGLRDLEFLPAGRCEWNATLAAIAYSARRRAVDRPDLNLWAAMHAVPASARYAALGRRALVLWHGTSAVRAEKIRQVGLFPKKGIWATAEPRLAHSFTRGRSTEHRAGSAMIVLVLDRENMPVLFERAREAETLRFRQPLGPEHIEYVLYDDRIDFVGAGRARQPRAWGVARFKRVSGRWVPRSRPPVRFDAEGSYDGVGQWLELSVRRVLATLGAAAAVEVFSSLYATVDPHDALPHEAVFEALGRLGRPGRMGRTGTRQFTLRAPPGEGR